jgi:hypothetical protein
VIDIAIVGMGKALEPHGETWLGVMPQLPFRAGSERLKQSLDDGALGDVPAATIRVPWWRTQAYHARRGCITTALHRAETEASTAASARPGNDAPGILMAGLAPWPDSPEWIYVVGARAITWLESESPRLNVLDGREDLGLEKRGSGGGDSVMASAYPVSTDSLALATQRLIEAIVENGGK